MNNLEMQKLLDRYVEGRLSEEEMAQLREATHQHEVMKSSSIQAATIRRIRKRNLSFVFVGVALLAGVGVLSNNNLGQNESVIVAQKVEQKTAPIQTPELECVSVEPTPRVESTKANPVIRESIPSAVKEDQIAVDEVMDSEPIESLAAPMGDVQVLCNLECDADSVLSDVLRFLKA